MNGSEWVRVCGSDRRHLIRGAEGDSKVAWLGVTAACGGFFEAVSPFPPLNPVAQVAFADGTHFFRCAARSPRLEGVGFARRGIRIDE